MTLSERYRPRTLADVVGQPRAVQVLSRLAEHGYGGRAYWLAGPSGSGKTTLARILAASVADPLNVTELVGRQLGVPALRDIVDRWQYHAIGKRDGHALVVNEAHGLSKPVIEYLLDVLESIPDHVVVVFTTTNEGESLFEEKLDAGPFGSRCFDLPIVGFEPRELPAGRTTLEQRLNAVGPAREAASWLAGIARAEGLDGRPEAAYVELVTRNRGNLRACLAEIEAGRMLA